MYIQSEADLRALFGFPKGRSKAKQLDALEKHSIQFIQLAPFLTLSTYDHSGRVDCSPRGGKPGFVKVINNKHILIPEAKGNNRLDSLVNILESGNVGCLFLIPGVDETLRINGTARVSNAAEYLALFAEERNPPKACIEIRVKEVFLHSAKALMRSELWSIDSQIERSSFPTMGTMINEQLAVTDIPESQDEMVQRYNKDL